MSKADSRQTFWSRNPITTWDAKQGVIKISVVFTWQLPDVLETLRKPHFFKYIVGGPAIKMLPDYLPKEVVSIEDDGNWLSCHNPEATRTSLGCPNTCPFCAVRTTEGKHRELKSWPPGRILCDSNFLGCSHKHRERVYKSLQNIQHIDFNQGLEARRLTSWDIDQLRGLSMKTFRFAWDHPNSETPLMDALDRCVKQGVPKSKFTVLLLVGYKETLDEARYRFNTLYDKYPYTHLFAMRYQPLDTIKQNAYCPPQWNESDLIRFVRYWNGNILMNTGVLWDDFDVDFQRNKKSGKLAHFRL